MDRAQVIADTLTKLHTEDYRSGFNDSVLSHCRDALDEFDGSGSVFWSMMLTGDRNECLEKFFDGDKDLRDYFDEVDKLSHQEGCFVMPSWGTRGT